MYKVVSSAAPAKGASLAFCVLRSDESVAMRGMVRDGKILVTESSEPSPGAGFVAAALGLAKAPEPPKPAPIPVPVVELPEPEPEPESKSVTRRKRIQFGG